MAEKKDKDDDKVEGEGLENEDAPKEDPDAPEAGSNPDAGDEKPKPKRKRAPKKKPETAAETEPKDEEPVSDSEPDADAERPADEKPKRRRRGAAEVAPPKPSASARRRSAEDGGEPVIVRAKARYVRTAPRKARLVVDHIRGKSVDEARAILIHTPRAASRDVLKLLDSAIANAENNHELVADELKIHQAFVDEGPTLKRYRPRALGRATRIRKRTSHMTILLTPKE